MHISPRSMMLHFKADVLRRLPAKVALAQRNPARHFESALVRIWNKEASIGKAYARGTLSQPQVLRRVRTLVTLHNKLNAHIKAGDDGRQLQQHLGYIARMYVMPSLSAYATQLPLASPGPVMLAQAHFIGESHA